MNNEKLGLEHLIKITTLRDVEIGLNDRKIAGEIVPDNAYEVLRELEAKYIKND